MVKRIAVIVGGLLVVGVTVVLILAAMKPDTFRVVRTVSIKAPPEKIYPLLNNFRSFNTWSPYETKDPNMKKAYSGSPSGKGAVYEWDGDRNVGQGRMEITDISPPSKIVIKLDFVRPFEANNIVEFTLEPKGDSTNVTWAMQGPIPYMAKVVHVLFNMDRMVGDDFAVGLANLKTIAEK